MDILKKTISFQSYWVFLIVTIIAFAASSICFFRSTEKWEIFWGGIAAAFLVTAFQFLVQVYEALRLQKFEALGVKEILSARKDTSYYAKLIKSAKKDIFVMGVTASRFLEDFAKNNSSNEAVLLEVLAKGVNVKILIPKETYLTEKNRNRLHDTTIPLAKNILKDYSNNFSIRHFDHIPAHSLVVVDQQCIAGPMFSELIDSKDTPAIVLARDSKFAEPYIKYFEYEWGHAEDAES